MPRDPILKGDSVDDEDRSVALRPSRMDDMVGQAETIARLKIAIDAAVQRGDSLGHVLFDGPPGLGKTTFALCMHNELSVEVELTTGAVLKAPRDLVPYLTNASERSILFIDEIHRLPKAVEEYLYTAMEDFRIDIILGDGVNARTHNLWLKPFTLIGATTRAGMLSGPLRDRFQIRETLGFYTDADLSEIAKRNAKKIGVEMDAGAADEIAKRSRSTPRIANNHLLWVRDFAQSKANGVISLQVAQDALEMMEVDERGLGKVHREYLLTLIRVFAGGPAGIESIAHTMNASVDTLVDEVEPFLLRIGFVVRTPRGRVARSETYRHLNLDPPPDDDQLRLFDQ